MPTFSSNLDDHTAIIQAVLDYAQGVADHDKQRIEGAFDMPKAQMKLITGTPGAEKVYVMPIEAVWDKIWSDWPDVKTHHVEITNITLYEGRMATVYMNNNAVFADELSLYKVNGSWKIYDKLTRAYDGQSIPEQKLRELFGDQS